MDDKTLDALKRSIAKWENNALAQSPTDADTSGETCPLCVLFFFVQDSFRKDCRGCPVAEFTRQFYCGGSPYEESWNAHMRWRRSITDPKDTDEVIASRGEAFRAAARREVAFLKALLPDAEA